jgi:hypothetical protein
VTKQIVMIAAMLASSMAEAAPFLVADPYPAASTPKPTHCGIYLDTGAKIEVAITSSTDGPYCKYDLTAIAAGAHVAKATHILKDPTWGTQESTFSNTINFTRPAAPPAPAGLGLTP